MYSLKLGLNGLLDFDGLWDLKQTTALVERDFVTVGNFEKNSCFVDGTIDCFGNVLFAVFQSDHKQAYCRIELQAFCGLVRLGRLLQTIFLV